MEYLKSYKQLNEEVLDVNYGIDLTQRFLEKMPKDPEEPAYKRLKEIAKNGNLYKYLVSGDKKLTFGMLKALHADALKFKQNRELKQGIQKFFWRAIPLALAPVFFPIWIISQILGATRAFNKIMIQVLKMDNHHYHGFILNIINKFMDLSEGEIERFLEEDWFYKSFAIEKGLLNMVKKEHIIEFSYYIIKKIKYQSDDAIVPSYYIENEFRKFLNRRFRLEPPLLLKRKSNKHENF
jgi:hypothetical protein